MTARKVLVTVAIFATVIVPILVAWLVFGVDVFAPGRAIYFWIMKFFIILVGILIGYGIPLKALIFH